MNFLLSQDTSLKYFTVVRKVLLKNVIMVKRGGFTLGVQAFEAWLYTFMSH